MTPSIAVIVDSRRIVMQKWSVRGPAPFDVEVPRGCELVPLNATQYELVVLGRELPDVVSGGS